MSDESPWNKVPEVPQFSGLTLDQALALADAPRNPVFGLQFAQIIMNHMPYEDLPYVSFQCGISPFRVMGLVCRKPKQKLSAIIDQAMKALIDNDADLISSWLQDFRDAHLIKGDPYSGFSPYMAPFCSYTFQPSGEQADNARLENQ